ncbi:hypothetical protein DKM44_02665 [Deinococcus irradiatisoli]|uniref:Diguanylate cyclase n=1 Tax=Deinococcus irradiatisoli TaxID=2202254 RepID=A0A2Z3JAY0_9DEIO|nr:diguanylate cyclase [Deinococcus irradiatisoli]AWN22273.1 hypothetical protein DKM44_02665 [Deinococcus irradiatisoli]
MVKLYTYLLQRQMLLWAVLLLVGCSGVWTMLHQRGAFLRVQESRQEITQIQATLVTVLNLETGIRGYAITGETPFLEPYNAARRLIDDQVQALRRAQYEHEDESSPAQLNHVARIETLLQRWFKDIAEYEIANRDPYPERVVAVEKSGRGKQLIDAVRAEIMAYDGAEQRELQVRQAQAQRAQRLNQDLTIAGMVGAILISVLSSLRVARTLDRKIKRFADAAEQLAVAEQAPTLGHFRIQELNHLAHSFNAMSARLNESHSALAAHNAALQERNTEVVTSNVLAVQLQTCLNIEEGLTVLQRVLPQVFGQCSGQLAVLNPSRNLLEVKVHWPGPTSGVLMTDPSHCLAVRRGQVYDAHEEVLGLPCPLMGGAHLCLPLMAQGEMLGHLQLSGLSDAAGPYAAVKSLAQTIANQSALGLSNLRLRESLRQQSIRDPLTGLFNRRYLDETFERELQRAVRHGQALAVLMLDVDHFKRFNDTYGHDAGDLVLTSLGRLLREQFRTEDIVCRYGGEEFAVVMPGAELASALLRAEGLRRAAAALSVTSAGTVLNGITLSIGVSAYPLHGDEPGQLLTLADQALYRAKQTGRNRVIAAQS